MIFWTHALLFLVFFSKVSLAFIGVPARFPGVIFQHGLHPFANIFLSFVFGLPIFCYLLIRRKKLSEQFRVYRTLILLLFVLFFSETLLQILFLDASKGFYSWAALASTYWLIFIFGVAIPLILKPEQALRIISNWALLFVFLSLLAWQVRPDLVFKGGRFIGVFKHIPYMVTCATVGVVFTLVRIPLERNFMRRAVLLCGSFLSAFVLILTGTRSALVAVVMAIVLWVIRAPSYSISFRYFKYSTGLLLTVILLLFGNQLTAYTYDIATGKRALAEREAQDGVASRMEEVARGWEYFKTSPWIGRGLLSKFSGKESLDVGSYNSFKDPHNIFVSAGVVGGWPFIIWTVFFLLFLIWSSAKGLFSTKSSLQVLAIYVLVQIPILIIYHWHLSLGGMADRFYWLAFGYLAVATWNSRE